MATAETVDSPEESHDDHDDHGHGEFIAHHFESPEQQFDSGKLGMWLFIVQEILFFSGLFVAYTLLRYHHPEIFNEAYVYLNKYLGGINTIVLLFSSLTMAWAVRCSQVEQRAGTIWCIIITMACASIFLGIKAVEYSHKWDQGLFWAGLFGQRFDVDYLLLLSIPFGIGLVVCIIGAIFFQVTKDKAWMMFFVGMTITFAAYFAGVGGGQVIEKMTASHGAHGADHGHGNHSSHGDDHDSNHKESGDHDHDDHEKGKHKEEDHDHGKAADRSTVSAPLILQAETVDESEEESGSAHTEAEETGESAGSTESTDSTDSKSEEEGTEDNKQLGLFFSIYYIMTGLHAIHIIAGIVALAWLLYRAAAWHFRKDYFGPVENVGLYWHLVDLIWIYLFPLMYLIH